MTHEQCKFLGVIRVIGQVKEGKLMQLGYFFGEQQKVSFITKILAADELLSYVTITLRDAMI